MLKSESTKRCRKRMEGYSEIVEREIGPDIRSDIFRTKSKCINCKWLITSLIIITILVAGIAYVLIKELNSTLNTVSSPYSTKEIQVTPKLANQSLRSNGTDFKTLNRIDSGPPLHDRKKRNTSNATDDDEFNSDSKLYEFSTTDSTDDDIEEINATAKLYKYIDKLSQQFDNLKSAMNDFFKELKKYVSRVPRANNTERLTKRRRESPEVENKSSFISFSKGTVNVEDYTQKTTTRTEVIERISNTPDEPNISVRAGVDSNNDAEKNTDLNMNANLAMPNISTSPAFQPPLTIDTKPENHSENDSPKRDVTSSAKTTVSLNSDDENTDGSAYNDKNTIPANAYQSYTPIVRNDDELQKGSKNQNSTIRTNEPSHTEITTVPFDDSTQKELQQSANGTILGELQKIQYSKIQPENESSEIDLTIAELVSTTTKETNIMKIPSRTTSPHTGATTSAPPQIQITTSNADSSEIFYSGTVDENVLTSSEHTLNEESTETPVNETLITEVQQQLDLVYNETIDIIKNSTSRMYLFRDLDENSNMEEVLAQLIDRLKRELARKRHSRNTEKPDTQWHMFCFQKVTKPDNKFDVKFVKVPLNESDVEKIPAMGRNQTEWPSYTAHSLNTHKYFKQYTVDKQTEENMNEQPDKFTLSSTEDPQGSRYYCTYSQARDANETEKNLETRLKLLLANAQIDLNDLKNELCSSNERMCADESQCISAEFWCDEIIHCPDFSDEISCTCRDRINADKLCDGYFDCPNGEDEQGCFDCSKDSFSCDDWKPHKQAFQATCVPIEKRCDEVYDCPNAKDEKDCELLADNIYSHDTFLISYTSGYLHRNWKGKWYPVCEDPFKIFSTRACESELGVQNIREVTMNSKRIPFLYDGKFIVVDGTKINVTDQCFLENSAVYVDCPTEYCGSRVKSDNTYKYKSKREANDMVLETETDEVLKNLDRNIRSEDVRVVGGKISGPGFWPWIVALYKNGEFHCGAEILDETWLLTAAHCVEHYRDNYFEIQAGILRRLSFSPMEQNRKVTHVIVHTRYSRSDMKNDIALLRVDPPLKMNRWIRPICLPEARPPWGPTAGELCTAVGWGATHEHGPDPDNMREVEVPILPHCKHPSDIQGYEICAGYIGGQHDTCQGDSGGPLLCRIPLSHDFWYLAGIVSHGEGCARPMEPGVYTRIAIYLNWIVETTKVQQHPRSQQTLPHCPGMRCPKEGRCISRKKICDKVIDCLNGEDEINSNCQSKWIAQPSYKLRDSRQTSSENEYSNSTVGMQNLKEMKKIIGNFENLKKGSKFNVFKNWWPGNFQDSNINETYVCKIIVQMIPKVWHCDGEVDCQDGTDEINCTCSDILKTTDSSKICNSVLDCSDASDERNCTRKNSTTDNDYLCYQSYTWIKRIKVCDGNPDCPRGEDEKHCYALSEDSENITFDDFHIPASLQYGTIMENKNGTWKVHCSSQQLQDEMGKICNYLGFENLFDFENLRVLGKKSCTSIDLYCLNQRDELTILPWFGNIYVNGTRKCTGLLLTTQWLVADYNCSDFNLQEDYTVIVLGSNRVMENKIQSYYEQVIRIDYSFYAKKQGATVMHLGNPVNVTKYVKPFRVEERYAWVLPPVKDTNCFMIADTKEPTILSVIPEENYLELDYLYRPANKTNFCKIYRQNHTLSSLICMSAKNGWYLAAPTNKQFDDFCSFNTTTFSLRPWDDPDIFEYNTFKSFPSPNCSTYRCSLGNCLEKSKLCDGYPDCRNHEDETPGICAEKITFCKLEQIKCPCKIHEFRCKNMRCIDHSFICDGNNDCGDESDEPPECSNFTCATYLNITNPSKLCDNHVDCWDKSDENLFACTSFCKSESHFKCPKSGQCIPLEFVCDGESDCTAGEDEEKCWKLINSEENSNEPNLFVRKHGEFHKQCLSSDFTSFSPDVVCKESGFSKKKLVKFIPGIANPIDEYTTIILRNSKEFRLRAKPLVQSNSTGTCSYVHLKCE